MLCTYILNIFVLCILCTYILNTFCVVYAMYTKGVKKVHSDLHHRISNHLKGNYAELLHFHWACYSL